MLAVVLKKGCPFHCLGPGLHLLLQLDFPSQAPNMPSPLLIFKKLQRQVFQERCALESLAILSSFQKSRRGGAHSLGLKW